MKVTDIKSNEFDQFYQRYLDKVDKRHDIIAALLHGQTAAHEFFSTIPADRLTYRYAEGKWSVLEVLQHLIDTERVFMYRCFRIARRDTTPLAGFDQNNYIDPSVANEKSIERLLEEFNAVRSASVSLLRSLSAEDLVFVGNANGSPVSARAAAFMVPGHDIWHMDIIRERYL